MKRIEKQLTHQVSFRLDAELFQKLTQAAKTAHISRGDFIRRQLEDARITIKQEIIAEVPQLQRLIAEFGMIGSNLNQIARHYNGGGVRSLEMFDRTQQAISELYAMKYEVEKMGGEFSGHSKTHRHKEP